MNRELLQKALDCIEDWAPMDVLHVFTLKEELKAELAKPDPQPSFWISDVAFKRMLSGESKFAFVERYKEGIQDVPLYLKDE